MSFIILICVSGLVGFWIGRETIKKDEIWNDLKKWCEEVDNNCGNFCYGYALQQQTENNYPLFET